MRDPLGIVPPEIKARYQRQEFVDHAAGAGRALDRALKDLDPHLSCVFVRHNAPEEELPGGIIPGYWHVRRDNPPPAMPTFIPITTEDGGYRNPDFGVIEELQRSDLQRPGALREAMRLPDKTKEKELHREQRLDEMKADFRAAKRVAGEGGLRKRKWDRNRPKKKAA